MLLKLREKENVSFILGFMILFAYMLYKIRFGLHYDEVYLVDLGKVKMDGIKSVTQCWDILQMSGWAIYPFMALYVKVTGGYDGMILFMRVVYIAIHMLLAIFVYTTVQLFWTKRQAQVAATLSFLFLFHWYTLSYKSILYWGTMAVILFLLRYVYYHKARYVACAAIVFSVAVLAYPTLVLLTIPISHFLVSEGASKRQIKRDLVLFWGVCAVCAVLVLVGLMIGSSPGLLLETFRYTVSYESSDGLHKLLTLAELAVVFGAANMVPWVYIRSDLMQKKTKSIFMLMLVVIGVALAVFVFLRVRTAGVSRFWYVWYVFFCMASPLVGKGLQVEHAGIIQKLFIRMSYFLIFIIAISSANGWAVASYGGIFGIIGIMVALWDDRTREVEGVKGLSLAIMAMFVFAAVFFVPDNELGASNMFQRRVELQDGPGRGIYVSKATEEKYRAIACAVQETVSPTDKLMILGDGFRSYGFLMTKAKQVTHWPYIVYPDSERAVTFYEMFPELAPTVILIEEGFVDTYAGSYEEWVSDSELGRYVSENYKVKDLYSVAGWKVAR